MDSRNALLHLNKYLLSYEKTEIIEYDQIYFLNLTERKN